MFVLLSGSGVLLGSALARASGSPRTEIDWLGPEALPQSFGLGERVQFARPDLKRFHFEFTGPTRIAAVLHYQAGDISPNEVAVLLNGVSQGMVPSESGREVEQLLASKDLRPGAINELTFDNLKNPPGRQSWRIANPWLELLPLPDLPASQLRERADELALQGQSFFTLREVGPDNLFKAWKAYRQAWLTLAALPESLRPELYAFSAEQARALGRELDQRCSLLILEAQRQLQLKDPERAQQTLREVPRYFPTAEHRCHALALRTLNDYEQLAEVVHGE
jgi:hypothetical protein